MSNNNKSKLVEQTSCPFCPSSDAFTIYQQSDGRYNATCFSCGKFVDPYHYNDQETKAFKPNTNLTNYSREVPSSIDECLSHPIRPLIQRKLTKETCERFGVRVGVSTQDGETPIYVLFPQYKANQLTGFTFKDLDETNSSRYRAIGDAKGCDLFGSNLLQASGKKLFITEGAEDAMACYQALTEHSNFSWEPNVVAIGGAKTKLNNLVKQYDHFNKFEEIILCLDSDEAGREATEELCKIFSGKVYTVSLDEKDPNDMLIKGKSSDLKWALLTGARKYQPDGIINAKDCWDRYKDVNGSEFYPYPSFMPVVNKKIFGAFPSSLIAVTSGTGCGKTTLFKEFCHWYYNTTNHKIAGLFLEEGTDETIRSLISLQTNKRLNLPHVSIPEEQEQEAFRDLFDTGRFTFYDYFGGMDDSNLLSKLRYLAATGHKLIFLDHLSIVVSEYATNGDERKKIDVVMTNLAKLCKETGITIFFIVHLSNPDNRSKPFEEGAVPTLNHLRGSGSIKQLSWTVLATSRNLQHMDPYCARTAQLHILKDRKGGNTGPADFINFNNETGRYINVTEPPGYFI